MFPEQFRILERSGLMREVELIDMVVFALQCVQ
jgi:hypothetical protein